MGSAEIATAILILLGPFLIRNPFLVGEHELGFNLWVGSDLAGLDLLFCRTPPSLPRIHR